MVNIGTSKDGDFFCLGQENYIRKFLSTHYDLKFKPTLEHQFSIEIN